VGESKRFCARSIGEPEGRTTAAIVLPICAIGVVTTPICDEAMDDEACILLMIRLFFLLLGSRRISPSVIHVLVINWLFHILRGLTVTAADKACPITFILDVVDDWQWSRMRPRITRLRSDGHKGLSLVRYVRIVLRAACPVWCPGMCNCFPVFHPKYGALGV